MEKKFILSNEEIKELSKIKGSCIASDRITVEGQKVGYMYRETPSNEVDTGWRFFAVNEDEEYTNNPVNFDVYELNTICNYDEDIISYLTGPVGIKLERKENIFVEVDD